MSQNFYIRAFLSANMVIAAFTCFGTLALAQEQARTADSFVDSVGINQFGPNDTAGYFDLIHSYGFRHTRASLLGMGDPNHAAIANNAYATYGIKLDLLVDQPSTPAANLSWLHNVTPAAIDSVEGPNEVDGGNGIGNAAAPGYQSAWYNAVKGDAIYNFAPVLNFTVINDYQSNSDANNNANVHYYGFEDENNPFLPPAESPYGSGQYGSLAFDYGKAEQGITHPPKPIIFTEAGYFTTQGHGNQISRLGQAKYEPMLLASNFNAGIVRTYIYSMLDTSEGTDINNQPAGNAIRNLLSVLAEPGAQFTPGTLNYSIHTNGGNVQHILLQKSNGDFYLLLWNEIAVYDERVSPPDLNNAPISTTLNFSQPINTATVYTQNMDGSYTAYTSTVSGGSFTLSVPDSVTVVRLSAAKDSAPTAGATYTLVNQAAHLCLDDAGGGTAPGTNVQVWTCNNLPPQNWTLHDAGNGWFTLVNQASGLCLDDAGWGTTPGTNVIQWSCTGNANQNWQFSAVGNSAYTLMNQNSGLLLDDQYSGTSRGNNVWLWNANGTQAQNWLLQQR